VKLKLVLPEHKYTLFDELCFASSGGWVWFHVSDLVLSRRESSFKKIAHLLPLVNLST
jgi:hypothetical protein